MKDELNITGRSGLRSNFTASAKPTLTIDVEKYQAMLDGSGLIAEQRQRVLEDLWTIIVSFVELGFEVHPLQEVCGKDGGEDSEPAKAAFDAVNSENPEPE